MNNVTAENSQARISAMTYGVLSYIGPANVTVENTNVFTYGTMSNDQAEISVQLSPI